MQSFANRYLVACCLLVVSAGGTWYVSRERPHVTAKPPNWSQVPLTLGQWHGKKEKVDQAIKKYLAADEMISRTYTKNGLTVGFDATFGTQWRSLHSPAGCYQSQGWQIVSRHDVSVPLAGVPGFPGPLRGEELFAEKNKTYRLVLYMYVYPGGTTSSWTEQMSRVAHSEAGAGGIVLIFDSPASLQSRAAVDKQLANLLVAVFPYMVGGWGHGSAG